MAITYKSFWMAWKSSLESTQTDGRGVCQSVNYLAKKEREVRKNRDVSELQEVFKRISVVESRGRKCFWFEARRGCWPSVKS